MEYKPLVSIIIITYNSDKYVLETLDSAWNQTYPNIEIIVADDFSTDNTLELCRKWINKYQSKGKELKLVEAKHNTGVSGNCNRGFSVSRGEWIKVIAGDDILAPTAIENYIAYVNTHSSVRHLIANAIHFSGKFKEKDLENHEVISQYLFRDSVTVKYQYYVITKTFFGSGPTYFINSEALREVGGYDERFPMQEDYPLFIKMIGKGYKMNYLDNVTVYKRIVPDSLQYLKDSGAIFSKNRVRMIVEYKYQYLREALNPTWRLLMYFSLLMQSTIVKSGNSYQSFKCRLLYNVYRIIDPFVIFSRFIAWRSKKYLHKVEE